MKKIYLLICLLLSLTMLCGCSEVASQVETIASQVETFASQVDVESIVTGVIERIDWEDLKTNLEKGYDALTEKYPALKSENVKTFLKENGLELMKKYVQSTDETKQETARKLGEILKILNPELTDEVNSVIEK